ncbi:MAG TPA: class I adenylate-forming enzyme family protein [Gammaproteobacteria bacterium]
MAEQDSLPLLLGARGAVSRGAFRVRVAALRARLDAHPARRWALVCEDAGWFGAGLLALAGGSRSIVLPQAPQLGALKDTGVDAVLTDRPEAFAGLETLTAVESGDAARAAVTQDDATVVEFFTSGSSGTPKRVPKAYAQLRLEVEALERQWGAQLGDAMVAGTVPHHHLYGLLFRVLWPLSYGRPIHVPMCLQPAELRAAAGERSCVIVSSPAFLSRLHAYEELPPARQAAAVFSSGAPLGDEAARDLREKWGRSAIEVYGSTETGGIAWRAWDGNTERAWWRPIAGVDAEVREDESGSRLWARSGCTFEQDWMPSGDLARFGADGRFALQGRADDVLKFEDKRVSLSEMRAQLLEHPWVAEARLLLIPGQRQQLGAVVVLKPEGRAVLEKDGKLALQEQLKTALKQRYEALLVPRKWRFPAALPDNAMGKTEQARLLALFEAQP